ncbi:33595_t:CDS:2, partial [Gigaspora margarita]
GKKVDHQEESSYITRQQKRIGSHIASAAMKHIPWINIKKTETQVRISVPKHKIYREIKFLYQLQKKNQMHNGDEISLCNQSKFNIQIDSLNQLYQTQIPQMPKFWSQIDLENLKNWEKILRKKVEEEECKRKKKEISLKVEQRFSMMKNNKKRMLQSLLNRPYNKVTIDKVLLKEDSHYQNQELISDKSNVKEQ